MNLLLYQLATILEPQPTATMNRIPDIIPDHRACELLCNAQQIIEPHRDDQAAAIHIHGYQMAERLRNLAKARSRDIVHRCLEGTDEHIQSLADIHHAEQLAAHHLDMLDRLRGTLAVQSH